MTKIQVRKQFTTFCNRWVEESMLFSIWRRYKFESNSQPQRLLLDHAARCFQYDEDTSSKAIHNVALLYTTRRRVVFNMTKIQVRKQFTTSPSWYSAIVTLFSIWRRYKFESNSQHTWRDLQAFAVVFNMTKIQVRKQFTTGRHDRRRPPSCFQYDEDTSSKAIHNHSLDRLWLDLLFSIWRRYKFESNSQRIDRRWFYPSVVFNMTKIQVRKQFTTSIPKALTKCVLFSIWRRYKFESNSQLCCHSFSCFLSCFQYDEDTSSKAIHN